MHRYSSSLLLEAASNWKHKLYINSINTIDSTVLFFGIFIRFYLWYWNIITNERKMWEIFVPSFFSFLDQLQKKKSEKEKFVCSQVQWHPREHTFSHPITLFSVWVSWLIFSAKKASTCSSFFKPWATISVYSCGKALAFPINPLDKNVVKSSLFFSELMNLFQEAGSYILHLSGMWQWTLRLCIFLDFPQAFAEIRWGSLTSTGTEYPCSKWHTKNSGEHEGSLSMHNKFFL